MLLIFKIKNFVEKIILFKEEVKALIGDNLGSHLSLTVMEQCREHNIRFIFLPANSTHLTQPLDVAVFAPMKGHWRSQLNKYKEECVVKCIKNVTIPKKKFASMLRGMMEDHTVNNAANIRNLQYQNILIFILQKKIITYRYKCGSGSEALVKKQNKQILGNVFAENTNNIYGTLQYQGRFSGLWNLPSEC